MNFGQGDEFISFFFSLFEEIHRLRCLFFQLSNLLKAAVSLE